MAISAARPSKACFLILLLAGRELVHSERLVADLIRVGNCDSASCTEVDGQCPVGTGCCVTEWQDKIMWWSKVCTEANFKVLAKGMVFQSKRLFRHLHDFGINGGLGNFWAKGMFEHLGAFLEMLSAAGAQDHGVATEAAQAFWKHTLRDFQSKLVQMAPEVGMDSSKDVFSFGAVDFGDAVGMSSVNGGTWLFQSVRDGVGGKEVGSRLKPEAAAVWQALEDYNPSSKASAANVFNSAVEAGLDKFPPEQCVEIMAKKSEGNSIQGEAQNQGYDSLLQFAAQHRQALLDVSSDKHRDIISSYLDRDSSMLQVGGTVLAKAEIVVLEVIMTIVAVVFLIVVIYYTVQCWKETTAEEKRQGLGLIWRDMTELFGSKKGH